MLLSLLNKQAGSPGVGSAKAALVTTDLLGIFDHDQSQSYHTRHPATWSELGAELKSAHAGLMDARGEEAEESAFDRFWSMVEAIMSGSLDVGALPRVRLKSDSAPQLRYRGSIDARSGCRRGAKRVVWS